MNPIKEIIQLKGEPLTEVCFVTDYVQFGFSGSFLAAIANPIVITPDGQWRFPEPESRDKLCLFIGHELSEIVIAEGEALTLRFGCGKIVIPLDSKSRRFGEAANFTPGLNQPVQVF